MDELSKEGCRAHGAQRNADDAEEDAKFAIAHAYWAVEEAEYRVLDAALARKDADSMAGDGD